MHNLHQEAVRLAIYTNAESIFPIRNNVIRLIHSILNSYDVGESGLYSHPRIPEIKQDNFNFIFTHFQHYLDHNKSPYQLLAEKKCSDHNVAKK